MKSAILNAAEDRFLVAIRQTGWGDDALAQLMSDAGHKTGRPTISCYRNGHRTSPRGFVALALAAMTDEDMQAVLSEYRRLSAAAPAVGIDQTKAVREAMAPVLRLMADGSTALADGVVDDDELLSMDVTNARQLLDAVERRQAELRRQRARGVA